MGRLTRRPSGQSTAMLVATLAAGLALAYPSPYLDGLTLTATLVTLLVATLIAWRGSASRRPFAWGFALFGWAYFALTLGPLATAFPNDLFTTRLIELNLPAWPGGDQAAQALWQASQVHTIFIAHCLFTLFVGGLGGAWAARARSLNPEPTSES